MRWLDIELPEQHFKFCLLHIPCSVSRLKDGLRGEAKARFWNAVLCAAKAQLNDPVLFIGDFNTGAHWKDEKKKTFVCAEHFGSLSDLGWEDLWRHYNGDVKEYTWYSAAGNGFRLDHAFATTNLQPRIKACRYSHEEREAGMPDHSVLIVEVD